MANFQAYLPSIKRYWQNTPEFFSEKYETDLLKLLNPVNLFLHLRRKKVHEYATNVKGKKILDVGCGSGIFLIDFAKKGAKVFGVDYSQKMLDLAKDSLKYHKISKRNYELTLADATKLPFKSNTFDLILATGLTDYMTDEEDKKFIKEAARVLKKNGKLIITFPVESSPFAFVRSGIGLKIRETVFKLPPIHNRFSLDKVKSFLKVGNLRDEKHTKIMTTMWLFLARFEKN